MSEGQTFQAFVENYRSILGLHWLWGKEHAQPTVTDTSRIGLLAPSSSDNIILFGAEQLNQWQQWDEAACQHYLGHLSGTIAFIFCEETLPPALLLLHAEQHHIPMLQSSLTTDKLMDELKSIQQELAADKVTLHGVFMEVLGIGILLSGKSGVGKSELALGLIHYGHRLIADDAVTIIKVDDEQLVGTCPDLLKDFLEVRGLGIINIRAMFGDKAILERKRLQLIIDVAMMDNQSLQTVNRLQGSHDALTILDVAIPRVMIPIAPGRNLAVLVEAAVRDQILRFAGYHANQEFTQRQQEQLRKQS